MKLKVLASGSAGNSYLLENDKECLVIEVGVPFKELIRHVDHRKIVGCLVSHEHKDHAKYKKEYEDRGIQILAPYEDYINISNYLQFGNFTFSQFENHHNVPCYGFIVKHPEIGKLVFATDTGFIDYRFKDVNHWLIEANYAKYILDRKVEDGFNPYLADRIVKDHMSLETCKDYLSKNDLSKTRNIVLIHLSDSNSNAEQFKKEVHELTNKPIYIAEKGLEIDLDLCPL